MSDEETKEEYNVKEETEEKKSKSNKNPERVKAGHRLAAIGQKAKEEKMRKRLKEEMISPKYWILLGTIISSAGFLSLFLWLPFQSENKKEESLEEKTPPPKENKKFFG